jgi:hypothetical protein
VVSVDTTGAGDAFVAGLLASLAANGIPTDIAAPGTAPALAQTCGALATTAKGAMTALPYQHDLQRSFDPFGLSGGTLLHPSHLLNRFSNFFQMLKIMFNIATKPV